MAGPQYAGQYGPEGYETSNGRPARNTSVTVVNTDGTIATLYNSKSKQDVGANPTSTDEFGNLTFFAEPGEYGVVVNNVAMGVMVPIHPKDPALGAWGGQDPNPVVDWFNGDYDPREGPAVVGAAAGDMFRDNRTGDLYQLR